MSNQNSNQNKVVFGGQSLYLNDANSLKSILQKAINEIDENKLFELSSTLDELKTLISANPILMRQLTHEELSSLD